MISNKIGFPGARIDLGRYVPPGVADFDFTHGYLDPRFTFSRSKTRTYISGGVLKTAAINEPAFEDGGLSLEPQGTNVIANAGNMLPAGTGQITDVTSLVRGADGMLNNVLTRKIEITGGATQFRIGVAISSATDPAHQQSATVWVRALDGESLKLRLRVQDDGPTQTVQEIHDTWTPLKAFSVNSTHANKNYADVTVSDVMQSSGAFYLWGRGQIEAGGTPTSYIPTTTAAVIRAADNQIISGSSFASMYNPAQGAIVLDALWKRDASVLSLVTSTNGLTLARSGSTLKLDSIASGASDASQVSGTIDMTLRHKAAVAWSAGSAHLFVDGIKYGPITMSQMSKPDNAAFSGQLSMYGNRWFTQRPSDAQLIAMTTL